MRRGGDVDGLRQADDESLDDVAAFQQTKKLGDLLVQSRKVQRQPRFVVLRVRRRKQPLDRPCRVREGSLRLPRTGRVPRRSPTDSGNCALTSHCPSLWKWMSATTGLCLGARTIDPRTFDPEFLRASIHSRLLNFRQQSPTVFSLLRNFIPNPQFKDRPIFTTYMANQLWKVALSSWDSSRHSSISVGTPSAQKSSLTNSNEASRPSSYASS